MGQIKIGGSGGGSLASAGQSILGSDFTVTQAWSNTAGGNLAQVSTVEVTATFVANERVIINYVGSATVPSGSDLIVGYQIDSDTAKTLLYTQGLGGGYRGICFSALSAALTAGSHTFKLMAASSGADPTIAGASNLNGAIFEIIRLS